MKMAILGGSVTGSAAALLFARSGWQVTVIDAELDRLSDPGDRVSVRPGAPHTVQAHGFVPRAHFELATRMPDVVDALFEAGVEPFPVRAMMPPHLYDGGRPDDHELDSIRSRRVTFDRVLAGIVARQPGVTLAPAKVTGIEIGPGAPPRVTGFRLAGGQLVRADVLLDAGGRRSPVASWLAAAGIVQPERRDPCGVAYYGRHYRVRGERPPLNNGIADIHEFPTFLQLMFLGDNGRAMLALGPHVEDPVLKAFRHEGAFDAVLAANEAFAPWLEVIEPETGVFCLGALDNRMRALVADGRPLALGLHQVGDALAMTNPHRGRGMSMGLAAVGALHDLLTADGSDPDAVALAYDAWQRGVLAVYYREAAAADARIGQRLRASLLGGATPANAPAVELPEGHPVTSGQVEQAAGRDPDLFRVFLRALCVLDDERRIASPEVAERVRSLLDGEPSPEPPPTPPGRLHDRDELERLLAPFA